jgi:hypothetical protein
MALTHCPLPGSHIERGFFLDSIKFLYSEAPYGDYIQRKTRHHCLNATLQPDSSAVNALHPLHQ